MEFVSRRPEDTPFNQQKLRGWQLPVTLNGLIAIFFIIGVLFFPLGFLLLWQSNNVQEFSMLYDGTSDMDVQCSISEANVKQNCTIPYVFDEDVTGPIYVYYEISNFYQNHRRYVKSRSSDQLMGENLSYDDVESDCFPLVENGSALLNPCGLIANSFFNDVITMQYAPDGVEFDTDGIAWDADVDVKFKQVDGFVSAEVTNTSATCEDTLGSDYSDCHTYIDSADNATYYYWYPDDDSVQYLHESYPEIVSPLEGVQNEHFIVWMRTAGLPYFRKLHGKIDSDFVAGQNVTFNVELNFEVNSFGGSKSLVLTTLAEFGGKNIALGRSYLIIGGISLFVGIVFALKRIIKPRPLGDIRQLQWSL